MHLIYARDSLQAQAYFPARSTGYEREASSSRYACNETMTNSAAQRKEIMSTVANGYLILVSLRPFRNLNLLEHVCARY